MAWWTSASGSGAGRGLDRHVGAPAGAAPADAAPAAGAGRGAPDDVGADGVGAAPRAHGLVVQCDVFTGGCPPGEVRLHRPLLQPAPFGHAPVDRERAVHRREHRRDAALDEDEPQPRGRILGVVLHRVREATGPAHDGDGAVTKGDQRCQPAGFEDGWRQKQIRAGVDLPGQRFLRGGVERHVAGETPDRGLQLPSVPGRPLAHHHHLRSPGHDLVQRRGQQPHPLLRHQPGNHAEERTVRGTLQVADPLQDLLVRGLSGDEGPVIAGVDPRIPPGVELVVVDAVENAAGGVPAGAQQFVHPGSLCRREDLLHVAGADGVDPVREGDAPLEQGPGRGEPDQLLGGGADPPLIGDVVDREDDPGALQCTPVRSLPGFLGHQPAVPVVAVDDVGAPHVQGCQRRDGLGEQHERHHVVVLVAVRDLPVEPPRQAEREDFHSAQRRQATDHHALGDRTQRHVEGQHRAPAEPPVPRDHQADVEAELGQPLRQRTADVGQPAHLDERIGLRAGEQHAVRPGRRDAGAEFTKFVGVVDVGHLLGPGRPELHRRQRAVAAGERSVHHGGPQVFEWSRNLHCPTSLQGAEKDLQRLLCGVSLVPSGEGCQHLMTARPSGSDEVQSGAALLRSGEVGGGRFDGGTRVPAS